MRSGIALVAITLFAAIVNGGLGYGFSSITVPLASLGARKELRKDVLGELELRILFGSKLPEDAAEKAAAGWGGDRLVAYGDPAAPDKLPTVIDLSSWDSETDAKEAEAAARALLAKLAGKPEAAAGQPAFYTDANGEEWLAERKGDKLLMVLGAPAATHEPVAAEIWKTWKVTK